MKRKFEQWIKAQIKAREEWIDYLREASQNDGIDFYAGERQAFLDALEQLALYEQTVIIEREK